jgi:hypothetical protein
MPSQSLLDTFAIFRRPATDEDRAAQDTPELIPADGIYVDYERIAHAADGRRYLIVPSQGSVHIDPLPDSCLQRIHKALRRSLHGETPAVQRRALHFYNSMVRNEHRLAHRKPQEGLFLFAHNADGTGGGGGGTNVTYIREHGMFTSGGRTGASAVLSGLIPDGVATIDFTFARVHSRGRDHKPRVYPSVIRTAVPVQDNVVALDVKRSAEDAFPSKMVWRDSAGAVVRVVRLPG